MNDRTNYAWSGPVTKTSKMSEVICMNCWSKFYLLAVLGNDNVYRQLPGWCRKCDCSSVEKEQSSDE